MNARIPERYGHYLDRCARAQNAAHPEWRHHDVHEPFDIEQRHETTKAVEHFVYGLLFGAAGAVAVIEQVLR